MRINAPNIDGGTISALAQCGLRDTSAAFDLVLAATSSTPLSAQRTLTFDVVNADRTLKVSGSGTAVLAGLLTGSGLTVSTAPRLLGRTTAGAGAVEELTAGSSLSLSGGALNTIQDIRTSATPQFARMGLGVAADATTILTIQGGVNDTPGANAGIFLGYATTGNNYLGLRLDTSANIHFDWWNGTWHSGLQITNADGSLVVGSTTDTTSTTTGALVVAGGVGIAKAINVGTNFSLGTGNPGVPFWANLGASRAVFSGTDDTGQILFANGTQSSSNAWMRIGWDATNHQFVFNDYQSGANRATISNAGICSILNTTDATAYNAASVTLAGGLGVAKKIVANDTISAPGFSASAYAAFGANTALTYGPVISFQNAASPAPFWYIGVPGSAGASSFFIYDNSVSGFGQVLNIARGTGNVNVGSYLTVGAYAGAGVSAGDIVARRGATTGVIYFGDSASTYLYFDGTTYYFGDNGGTASVRATGELVSLKGALRMYGYGGDALQSVIWFDNTGTNYLYNSGTAGGTMNWRVAGNDRLIINGAGASNFYALNASPTVVMVGGATTSQSFGLYTQAGTNAADYSAQFANRSGTEIMTIRGDSTIFCSTSLGIGVAPASGIVSGKLIVQSANAYGIVVQSGAANAYTMYNLGRNALDFSIGVAGNTGDFMSGIAAGEIAFKGESSNKLHFGIGSGVPTMTIASGLVGINATPASVLDVMGPAGVTSFTGVNRLGVMVEGSTGTTDYSGIDFTGDSAVVTGRGAIARIGMLATSSGSLLVFGTSNSYAGGITNTALTIDYNGFLGILTAPATYALTVGGDVNLTSGHSYRINGTAVGSGTVTSVATGTGLTGGTITTTGTISVTGILSTFVGLANAAGDLKNNGSGTLSYRAFNVSTSAPSGTPADGDLWLVYTP